VLVVSHRFWQETLGGDPAVVGRPLRINGGIFLLVGVTAKGFQGTGRPTPLYLPLSQSDRVTGTLRLDRRELAFLGVLGRRTGSLAGARATLDTLGRALDAAAPPPPRSAPDDAPPRHLSRPDDGRRPVLRRRAPAARRRPPLPPPRLCQRGEPAAGAGHGAPARGG